MALLADPAASGVLASFERPDRRFTLVAVGEAGRVEVAPGEGPATAREDAARLLSAEVEADAHELRPRLLGGFAFRGDRLPQAPWEGFGCGTLLLPRLLFVRDGATNGVVIAPGVEAGELAALIARAGDPPPAVSARRSLAVLRDVDRERWRRSVAAIAAQVRDGLYEKAVLAASRELGGDGMIAIGAALQRLRVNYSHCHLFSFSGGGATFLGASPELLVALRGGAVEALGLAGSAERGETDEEDARRGRALLESAKDRIEHETVVRAIREALSGATSSLRAPNQPQLWRLRNIQHLATEVSGPRAAGGGRAGSRAAAASHTRRLRVADRRRAQGDRRTRGLRPRLVRWSRRLDGRRGRWRVRGGAALGARARQAGVAVRGQRNYGRLRCGGRAGRGRSQVQSAGGGAGGGAGLSIGHLRNADPERPS